MKIVCPTCEATYEVPESVSASKRQVRCARCNNDWVPGDTGQAAAVSPAQAVPEDIFGAVKDPAPDDRVAVRASAPQEQLFGTPQSEKSDGTVFEPVPPATEVADAPPTEMLPPAAARLRQAAASAFGTEPAMVPVPAPPTRQPIGAWIVSVMVLIALAAGAVVFRTPVMKAWPASERAYAALGLHS